MIRKAAIAAFFAVMLVLTLTLVWVFHERQTECEARDGMLVRGSGAWVCISREALK
ncbi:hypothetical protein D3C76_1586990 [compost metagenome]